MKANILKRRAGAFSAGLFGIAMLGTIIAQPAAASAAVLTCNGQVVTIHQSVVVPQDSPGPDVIMGTVGNDSIQGGNDDDVICSLDGHDVVTGGNGSDWISGGDSYDTLTGGEGDDTIYGNEGPDQLYGGEGDDDLLGGTGNDALRGEAGDDQMHCGDGVDNANGGAEDVADVLSPVHGCEAAVGLP
jgi:Ca2+-binding RTX toxin-like protein